MSLVVIPLEDLEKIIALKTEEACKAVLSALNLDSSARSSDELYSQTEICDYLKITRATLIKIRKKKNIPYLQVGSDVRYTKADVIAALQKNK